MESLVLLDTPLISEAWIKLNVAQKFPSLFEQLCEKWVMICLFHNHFYLTGFFLLHNL